MAFKKGQIVLFKDKPVVITEVVKGSKTKTPHYHMGVFLTGYK